MADHLTPDEKRTLAKLSGWREWQKCEGDRVLAMSSKRWCQRHQDWAGEHDIPMPDFENDPAKVCAVFDALDNLVKNAVMDRIYDGNDDYSWLLMPIHIALAKAIAAVVGEH